MDLNLLLKSLRIDEGMRLKPYLDTALPPRITIGFGRNLSDIGISEIEAEYLLTTDAIRAMETAALLVPRLHEMNDTRQRVVANMAFNMGYKKLSGFSKFLSALHSASYEDAADEMVDSAWYSQVKGRAVRLVQEMRTGVSA